MLSKDLTSVLPYSWTSNYLRGSTSHMPREQMAHCLSTIEMIFNSGHDSEERKRPVIIHRAILGSVERMIAVLTESCGGKWYNNN